MEGKKMGESKPPQPGKTKPTLTRGELHGINLKEMREPTPEELAAAEARLLRRSTHIPGPKSKN